MNQNTTASTLDDYEDDVFDVTIDAIVEATIEDACKAAQETYNAYKAAVEEAREAKEILEREEYWNGVIEQGYLSIWGDQFKPPATPEEMAAYRESARTTKNAAQRARRKAVKDEKALSTIAQAALIEYKARETVSDDSPIREIEEYRRTMKVLLSNILVD